MKKLFAHRPITALSAAALAFVIGGCAWALGALHGITDNPLILHFNDLNGITQVGSLDMIVFIGIFGVVVTLMNGAIAIEFEDRSAEGRFFGRFLAIMTLVFAVLLFIAFAAIINANV